MSSKYEATAICHALGGPDYSLRLFGQAVAIKYTVSTQKIDFGVCFYDAQLVAYVALNNTGPIPINFSIHIPQKNKFKRITIDPMNGEVNPNHSQVFKIRIVPGLPIKYLESFSLRIGKFDVVEIELLCDCYFQQLQADMERHEDDPLLLA